MSRSDADRASSVPWPPIIVIGGLALGFILQALLPIGWPSGLGGQVLRLIGVVAVLAALAIFGWALASLRRRRTTFLVDRPSTALVSDGPYAYSRNPIYCGILALFAGVGLVAANLWLLLLAPVAAVLLQKLAIEPEERHLEARFGDTWRAYAGKVRRWL